jgi:glycosyltransferase involved in cell wall biosynthesis
VRILLLDRGLPFDGATLREAPLGGAESAFIHLAEALASLGHEVEARTAKTRPQRLRSVAWANLDDPPPRDVDLLIANRVPALLDGVLASRKVLWLHNPARYLRKPRHFWPLLLHRPPVVVLGRYHASTVPWFIPHRAVHEISLGLDPSFAAPGPREAPPPVAIFTSNPERGLDWLVDLWRRDIHPALPQAELHVYAGAATYGGKSAPRMEGPLAAAAAAHDVGVRLFAPLQKRELRQRLLHARVMAYRGDAGETFCLAAAEASACGVPLITGGIGALAERVVDGETGFLARTESAFTERLLQTLRDDDLWRRLHRGCLARPAAPDWEQTAKCFAALAAPG